MKYKLLEDRIQENLNEKPRALSAVDVYQRLKHIGETMDPELREALLERLISHLTTKNEVACLFRLLGERRGWFISKRRFISAIAVSLNKIPSFNKCM